MAYKIQTMSSNRLVKVYSDTFCRTTPAGVSHIHIELGWLHNRGCQQAEVGYCHYRRRVQRRL